MKTTLNSTVKKIALGTVGALVLLPLAAQATCSVNGPIVRVTQYADNLSSTGCYIYMRSYALSSYFYYTYTTDDNVCNSAVVAATAGVDALVNGTAASCPTTGSSRSMGSLRYFVTNP